MKAPTALIADDEEPMRDMLRTRLRECWPELAITAEAANGVEAIALAGQHQPDVVFLDIRMPGLSGIEAARMLFNRCHIVFVTAYDQYAIEAFEQGALDYLLIDLPPGTGEPQQSLSTIVTIDGAVVVTTPQDLSLLDAGRSLGLFRQAGVPILGAIENMSYLICPHCGERIEVFHRSERRWQLDDEAIELLGRIPMGLAISRGIDEGHPLLQNQPDAAEAVLFRAIAERIGQKLAGS